MLIVRSITALGRPAARGYLHCTCKLPYFAAEVVAITAGSCPVIPVSDCLDGALRRARQARNGSIGCGRFKWLYGRLSRPRRRLVSPGYGPSCAR